MLMQIIEVLAWISIPATLLAVVDDWFLRPRRQLALAPQVASDPVLITAVYYVLPVLIIAGVVALLSEDLDFQRGAAGDLGRDGHHLAGGCGGGAPLSGQGGPGAWQESGRHPGTGYGGTTPRSFFPVALAVLVLRAFVFEPFRIPSDSMMPTLLDGDFIIVNKFAYGLRLPVLNQKIVSLGEPQRGDVVVFRYPVNPSVNFIKRLVGLPGDRVEIKDDKLIVNGQPVPTTELGLYDDGCYEGMHLSGELLGMHRHRTLSCPTPGSINSEPLPTCNRNPPQSYVCVAQQSPGVPTAATRRCPWWYRPRVT